MMIAQIMIQTIKPFLALGVLCAEHLIIYVIIKHNVTIAPVNKTININGQETKRNMSMLFSSSHLLDSHLATKLLIDE